MLHLDAIMKFKRARSWLAQLVARADRLGLVSKRRWIGMDKNRHAILPILCERGTDESVLIIAFSGGAQKLDVPVHEFFETTKTLGYNRILLWDRYYMYYHYGVDRKRRDWPSLIEYLQQEIARLQPKKVLCVGTSSGGYAAIVAGHHLKADFVHAFGPQTEITLDRKGIRDARHPVHRWRMSISNRVHKEVLDLVPMLREFNGKTRYFVHYGTGHEIDRCFAERIAGLPSVTTLGYQCDAHAIAIFVAKKKFLGHVLLIENQNRLAEIAKDYFGEKIRITVSQEGTISRQARRNEDISRSYQPTM
jgi:hypothetical protein